MSAVYKRIVSPLAGTGMLNSAVQAFFFVYGWDRLTIFQSP